MGKEIELPLWIAQHLVQMGHARFKEEEQLTLNTLSTTHYRQTLPASNQIPELPRSFYFQLRRLIKDLKNLEVKDRTKARELARALALGWDIVNLRVKKIASLRGSGGQTNEVTSKLTLEEKALSETVPLNVQP